MKASHVAISVVMATYNGEQYLREQLDSIVSQLGPADELVVSDDRSTDCTRTILSNFAAEGVTIVDTEGRLGPIRNFENALQFASGDIIVLADQDDVWLPGRLDRIRAHFATSISRYDMLVLDSEIVDGALNPTQGSLFSLLSAGPGFVKNIVCNTYVGCHMAFRRELLDIALPFPPSIPMHDVWLGLVSESVGPVTFAPGRTMLFRRYGSNYTQPRYSLRTRLYWRTGLILSLLKLRFNRALGDTRHGRAVMGG
jgi:glycosyltransferase involved in cell wall biosynthesis